MDYLDPKVQKRHRNIMFAGYILIASAIVFATMILVNEAYGYNLTSNGDVIQNGLIFFSSHPNPANIYINNHLNSSTTDTSLYLQSGIYKVSIQRNGYNSWQRTIELDGGSVIHFDYPFLFPTTLTTSSLQSYASQPSIMTQSPDNRWLIIAKPGALGTFDLYDLKSPSKAPTTISLPTGVLSKATTSESLQVVSWADDDQHVLLEHIYDGKTEFILLDRANPDQSLNLNTTLATSATSMSLINKKYNQYYLYDSTSQSLQSTTLSAPTDKVDVLDHVLAYESYGTNTILYVTDTGALSGKALLKMQSGSQTYTLHSLPLSPAYVVDLTQYSGTMYVAAGASNDNKVYIYNDPLGQLSQSPHQAVTPIQVLHVNQPNYLSFSDNAQFIVAENGPNFGVYDIQNQQGYNYTTKALDAPQTHANWMDGDRLDYVNKGKLFVFDYDDTNPHVLQTASSQFMPVFSSDYKFVYSLTLNSAGQYELDQTWLLAPADR